MTIWQWQYFLDSAFKFSFVNKEQFQTDNVTLSNSDQHCNTFISAYPNGLSKMV